jgi:GH24 family phage-related lysozyme (muramidase)
MAEQAARQGRLTPHQLASLTRLDELIAKQLTAGERQDVTDLWRAQGSPAAPSPAPADGRPGLADPAWLAPALGIVQDFEGCRLQAYRCPAGVSTIGWGATRYLPPRGAVRMGDTITQAQADELLRRDLLDLRGPGLLSLLPVAASWAPNRIAALVSWAYNVGLGAVEESSLRRRILAGEDPARVVAEELPRWNKADGKASEGLARRRAAEVALFLGAPAPPLQQPAPGTPGRAVPTTGGGWGLEGFPFFSQVDPSDGPEGARQCQTSSIAMALRFMRVPGIKDDTDYLKVVRQFGDTTVQESHRKALAKLGVRARFTKRCSVAQLQAEIKAGLPVVCGVLHHGPVSKPTGGGHYVTLFGFDGGPRPAWHVHDPYGELDLVNGGWTRQGGGAGRDQRYSFKNFNPRWDAGGEQWTWLFS